MERKKWFTFMGILLIVTLTIAGVMTRESFAAAGTYKILAWNDLGMHCYSSDFSDLAVLPPYNTLWVQVVKSGDPPELVTAGITVEYYYADNTYSVGKTNFWDYDQALFGVDLVPDVGLTGKGLAGTMDLSGDHFIAEGIPVTEFSDSAPTVPQPYQLATVVVKDSTTNEVLATTQVVTPTSSEMRCDNCHSDTGIARPSTLTGKVETNILQLHDEDSGTTLMANRPVLCASCHASNALGTPGQAGVKNLSKSMHQKHAGAIPGTLAGCYNCHPGPQTRCLRDVMAVEEGMTCVSCHGGMATVSNNPNPWLNEPRCDSCHNSGRFNQDQPLYRFSKGHGGLYCESCHDSTHAVAPSREANDAIKFMQLQGENGPIEECSVCHLLVPEEGGPHSATFPKVTAILRANASPTSSATVNFTITFSEHVTGVGMDDFVITKTGVTGAAITTVTGSGETYTVTAKTGSGNGTIRLDLIDDDSIENATGHPLGGNGSGDGNFTNGEVYTVIKNVPGIPVLLAPASGALVTSLQPALDWKDSTPQAHHYQVQLSTNNTFTSLIIDEKNSAASIFTLSSDLLPGKLYFWRVRAYNAMDGASAWSSVRTFKTPLAQPALVSPTEAESLLIDRPTFNWNAVDGATSYVLQVSAVNNFSTLLVNATANDTAYTMTKDLPQNKVLYWRVRAKSSAVTGPWSLKGSFKTGNPPTVPVLIAPLNNALVKNYKPTLDWKNSTVPTATTFKHYELELDEDSDFSSSTLITRTVSDYTPDADLASNTRFYWRVRAVNTVGVEDHVSGWSPVWSFRTVIAAPQSLTMTPNDLNPLQPSFSWDAATGPGTISGYTLQISTRADFSVLLVNSTSPNSFYAMAKNLPAGKTIHWRVRVNGANGPSAWVSSEFTTP